MKKIYFAIFVFVTFCLNLNTANAANYYWVGGTGNWSEFATHWATTSGGAVFHATAPGPADDVYFDANSFPLPLSVVTVDVMGICNSMNWTGITNNPDFAGSNNLDIYGSIIFDPGMTASYTGWISFRSNSVGNILNFSTVPISFSGVEFDGDGGWTFMSDMDLSLSGGALQVLKGTVNTNDFTISVGMFGSFAMNNRNIIFGNSIINVQWNLMLNNVSTLTFDAGTSTINLGSNWFDGQGLTYYDVNFVLTMPGEIQIQGSNTFHTIGLDNSFITGVVFEPNKINTIYDINFGATCSNRKTIKTWTDGETTTIKKITGTVTEDYLNIKDITVIGGATFITNNGVDMGNVVNWAINPSISTDYYWVGGTGNWSDANHWSTSSGGAYPSGGTCVPTDVDNVFFDANSFSLAGEIVTVDVPAFCNSMDWTGVTNNPDLANIWPGELNIYGSLTFDAGMTISYGSSIYFRSDNAGNTITLAGKVLNSSVYFNGTGEWAMQDNLNCTWIYFNQGYLITNNNNISGSTFYSYTNNNRQVDLGSSVVTLTSNWSITDNTNMILNSGTSTINTGGWSFDGGGFIYNNVTFTNTSSTSVYHSNTFNILTLSGGDLVLEQGQTQVVNDLIASGNCGDLLNIKSSLDGSVSTISKAAGLVNINYVALQDVTALGGATFNANNSVDLGNAAGWNFTALASIDYYWIGGAGNWSDPLNWSLTSGGPANAGGCIPTQVDNVFFDGNSGLNGQAVTINQIAFCKNMNWTGATNARMSGTNSLNVFGSLTYNASMITWHTGDIYFKSDNIGNTINTAGVTVRGHVRFDGTGEWTLLSNFTSLVSNDKNIYLNEGSIVTNNFNITTSYFYSTTDKTRQLTLGNSTIDVDGWRISNGANMTTIPGTSTIDINESGYVQGGSQTYNIVNINPSVAVSIYGGNTFNSLNIPSATSIKFEGGLTQTFNTIIIPSGIDCNNYFNIGTITSGDVANLSMPAGIFNGNWLIISDLTAGGGGVFNAANSQGIGVVTGWNITSPVPTNLYWIADGGDWNDPLHWSLSSGGAPYGCVPSSEDNVFFDANSFSAPLEVVNVNVEGYCKNMNWSGVTNTPDLSGWAQLNINGSLTLVSAMTLTYWGTFNFTSDLAGNNITSAGLTIYGLKFSGSGDYTLQDALTIEWNGITFNNGILNTNDFNINIPNGNFLTNSTSIRTLNLGASIITAETWNVQNNTNFTLNAGTSKIITSNNTWNFTGGGLTYNDVTFINPMWGGVTVYGSNTFNTLYVEPGTEVIFEDGTIQTTTDFLATGNPSDPTFIHSFTPGIQSFISQTSHDFCGDWMNIQDISVSTETFYAGENSNDLGNNAGWTWSGVTAIDQYPSAFCEDVPGGGTYSGVNLTLLETTIDGGNAYSHTWFLDAGLTILVPVPSNVTVSNGQIFYDEVDNGTCTNIAEVIYTVYPVPVASFIITDVTCNGGNDGAVDLTVNSGTSPYTYLWSSGAGTEDVNTLIAGTYTVTVTDFEGCQTIDNAIVLQPTAISIDSEASTNITCNGANDGTITITASGGTGILSYDIGAGAQATGNFSSLSAGTYTVTVTDASLCTATSSAITIINPAVLIIVSEASTNITCNGANDGTITITASGGTGILSYDLGLGSQATGNFSSLSAGTYTVTVTDANLCTATSSAITILNPTAISIDSEASTNITCNGANDGTITITASGGTGILSYDLGLGSQATGNFSSLSAGTYTVTVTDANLCTATSSAITILSPTAISIDSEASTNITCNGANDGTITITASGGTGILSYDLGAGAQATGNFSSLSAGTYTVTVTDASLCTATSSAITINEPSALVISETHLDVTCNGNCDGSINITVVGGTPPYFYTWSHGAIAEDISGLCAGTYCLTVTDFNACTAVLCVPIAEPSAISIDSEASTNITCNGANDGTITITASGGTGILSYDLGTGAQATGNFIGLSAGTYTVTVTDANFCTETSSTITFTNPSALSIVTETSTEVSCNGGSDGTVMVVATGGTGALSYDIGSGAQIDGNFTGLLAGTYTVTVTDANLCTITSSTFVLNDPSSITIDSETFTDILCNGINDGSVSVTASGGTGILSYNIGFGVQATGDFSGLIAGLYTVTVTDVNGCFNTSGVFTLTDPAPITLTETHTDITVCGGNDGGIDLTVSGGTGGWNYDWSGPGAFTASTEDISGLIAGSYIVVVSDANACEESIMVGIGEVGAPTISLDSQTDLICYGVCDGNATVSASGGIAPYTYTWSNGDSGTFADSLCVGSVSVSVVDDNTCTAIAIVTILEPTQLVASYIITDETCFEACDGTATITAGGGTPALSYDIGLGPQATGNFSGLCAGLYYYTITDANGCELTDSFTILPYNMTDSISASSLNCFGDCDAIASVAGYGGSGSYSYLWSNTQTTATIAGLCADSYYVTIADIITGCFLLDTIIITEPTQLSLVLSSTDDNEGIGDGTATAIVSGGTPGYSYLWDDPSNQTTSVATGLFNGLYTVIVTDSNGCVISDTITVHLFVFINDISISTFIKIYPNPNHGDFVIEFDGKISEDIRFEIYNVNGQEVYSNMIKTPLTSVSLDNNAEGVYFIRFYNNYFNKVEKIVIR